MGRCQAQPSAPAENIGSLMKGAVEVFACGFVLYQHHTLPEKVDEATFAFRLLDWRFKRSDAAARDTEHVKEAIPEALGFRIFRSFTLPLLGEGYGAVAYFIPGCRHVARLL